MSLILLRIPEIQNRIADLKKSLLSQEKITPERIIEELSGIAFSDIGDILSWDIETVTVRTSSEISEKVRKTIKKITVHGEREFTLELHDKIKAIDALAKYMLLFHDATENLKKVSEYQGLSRSELELKIVEKLKLNPKNYEEIYERIHNKIAEK